VLEAWESAFVVFHDLSGQPVRSLISPSGLVADLAMKLELKGPWSVRFTPGGGAPEQVGFPELISWTDHTDPGIKHFSGAAFYSSSFEWPADGQHLTLDLGKVAVLASVKLNGRDLGVLWKEPFAIDVSKALRPGRNDLEIRVVNTWNNRLIADAALPENKRITWTTWSPFQPGDALQSSGLLGPVVLRVETSH
jgi:hypothetical protein